MSAESKLYVITLFIGHKVVCFKHGRKHKYKASGALEEQRGIKIEVIVAKECERRTNYLGKIRGQHTNNIRAYFIVCYVRGCRFRFHLH